MAELFQIASDVYKDLSADLQLQFKMLVVDANKRGTERTIENVVFTFYKNIRIFRFRPLTLIRTMLQFCDKFILDVSVLKPLLAVNSSRSFIWIMEKMCHPKENMM